MSVVSIAPAMLKDNVPLPSTPPAAANETRPVPPQAARRSRVTLGDDGKPLYVRAKAPEWTIRVFAMLCGIALFIGVWEILSKAGGRLPDPATTWKAAVVLFSDPFYSKGPNDQGIGWNILNSLGRVGIGFGAAAAIGIPLGFMIGRFRFLSDMASPIISMLRPVSPLAWLPIGLLVFKAANPAAIYVIFISSIWPMIINTALGVKQIPTDYMNVAKVLNLSEWKPPAAATWTSPACPTPCWKRRGRSNGRCPKAPAPASCDCMKTDAFQRPRGTRVSPTPGTSPPPRRPTRATRCISTPAGCATTGMA